MYRVFLILTALLVSSCGGFELWAEKHNQTSREVASLSLRQLLKEESESFETEIEERLNSLHSYYTIGQMNLAQFDQEIQSDKPLEELYGSNAYLNLLAVWTQVDEVEAELKQLWLTLSDKSRANAQKKAILISKLKMFQKVSTLQHLSVENVLERLGIGKSNVAIEFTSKELTQEYERLKSGVEFQVYEKNIDHLSHLLKLRVTTSHKKFFPSTSDEGIVTGNEFPSKVWALTFDEGPGKLTTPLILKNLTQKGLRATFFQLTQEVNGELPTAKLVRDAGMEIASHSYTHKQLTKVGALTLEREIDFATKDLEKALKVDIKFFRLPYGAGVNDNMIREKLAQNHLIHAFWNVDTLDWMAQTPDKIIKRTKLLMQKTHHDAGIIIFHDVHERTVVASKSIMAFLKENNRRTCTLDTIVKQMNEGVETVCSK